MRARSAGIVGVVVGVSAIVACVASSERSSAEGNLGLGEAALARLQCTSCHVASDAAMERLKPDLAPKLDHVGARRSPAALRELLEDPGSVKPDSAMPDVLASLSSSDRKRAIDELTHFLASLGGPLEPRAVEVGADEMERGRQLFHSVGCVACHVPQETVDDLKTPLWGFEKDSALAPSVADALGLAPFDTSVDALAEYLVDPLAVRPSGRMPSLRLKRDEAHTLAVYLLRGRVKSIDERAGWRAEYFELEKAEPDFAKLAPERVKVVDDLDESPEHRKEHFAFRFTGIVDARKAGMATFFANSDDGSWIYVDGKLVVDNGGDHSEHEKSSDVWLERGKHLVEVRVFNNAGDYAFEAQWKPAGEERQSLAKAVHWRMELQPPSAAKFELDDVRVARGRDRFGELGCAACHALDGVESARTNAAPLAELTAHTDRGCLADSLRGNAPRFALSADERASLRLAVSAAELERPLEARDELNVTIARFKCAACHTINGCGGPNEATRGYFKEAVEVDLGNEGRLPPALNRVGAKLREGAIRKTLCEARVERPYLATRMPQFGEANVGRLPKLFELVDGDANTSSPPFDATQAELGRQLAGEKGLGCVQCHLFNGTRSLGIPAVDLAHVAERVKPAWFTQLLLDPKSLGMNTRMPVFWDQSGVSSARDILGGDPKKQVEALWSYVSLGTAMPLPDGLVVPDSEYELVPKDEPILVSVFFEGASPRTMLVGTPQLVHYAFDIENSRLVCAWRGRFYNAKGTWNGRAGKLERPPSDDVVWFPKLAPIAILPNPEAPWLTAFGRDAGFRRVGSGMSSNGTPSFDYRVEAIDVLEYISACPPEMARDVGATFLRGFMLESPSEPVGVYVLFAAGKHIEKLDNGWWSVDERMRVKWMLPGMPFKADPELELIHTPTGAQLRAPAKFSLLEGRWVASVTEMVDW